MIRTMRELREARATVAQLAANEERLRLARDLHDLLGHSLSLITLKSELTGRMLPDHPEEAAQQVADIEQVSRQALVDVREAVSGYRRPTLAGRTRGRPHRVAHRRGRGGRAPSLDAPLARASPGLGPEEEGALAWALREAVTNVVRHSGAQRLRGRPRRGAADLDGTATSNWRSPTTAAARAGATDAGQRAHRPGGALDAVRRTLQTGRPPRAASRCGARFRCVRCKERRPAVPECIRRADRAVADSLRCMT